MSQVYLDLNYAWDAYNKTNSKTENVIEEPVVSSLVPTIPPVDISPSLSAPIVVK
jgi:hypothetical protein